MVAGWKMDRLYLGQKRRIQYLAERCFTGEEKMLTKDLKTYIFDLEMGSRFPLHSLE